MNKDQLLYFPEAARPYCYNLWLKYQFQFIVSKNRSSKLGDYRFDPKTKIGRITANTGLNLYQFLITYIHEVAHHVVTLNYSRKPAPHGVEWKNAFRTLMTPLLENDVFPVEINGVLNKHMKNPKASSGSDVTLWHALNRYNQPQNGLILFDLPDQAIFNHKQKTYQKISKRRTRILCEEVNSKRKYLIPGIITVTPE